MFEFGFYALILILVALAFVVVPLMLAKTVERKTDDSANIELAKNKLKELKAELAAGNLTQALFDAAKQELEVGLYHDLHDGAAQQSSGNGRWLIVPLLFIVPVVSLGLYTQLGDFRAFEANPGAAAQQAAAADDTSDQINAMVVKLEQRLQQQPNDVKGWLMLGRSYKALKRFDDAVAALKKAQALQGDNADILLQIADVLAVANDGSMQGEPTALVEQALKLQPDNEIGLWLSGMSKAEVGQYDEAIALWRKLQQRYQPGQAEHQEVQDMINTALERSGKPPEAVQTVAPAAAASASPQINVTVTLDDKFKASVKADDTLMVYVKAANGPKMPLAAVKRQVKDLPLTISFDDSMAMMPTMKISSVDEVIVTARVSRSGNAIPEAGEPIGTAKVMGDQRKDVKIVINQQVP
jgi:cytochrome c-type biogenesis protein CcmH